MPVNWIQRYCQDWTHTYSRCNAFDSWPRV